MTRLFNLLPLKTWLIGLFILLLVIGLLGWRAGCKAADEAKEEASLARTTGKQLDKVAGQTADIRQDQQEKQREVDKIEGSDQPLDPGYGSSLERVRRGG